MRKTSNDIADTLLMKEASRWREAIRSGEISGPQAEMLKQRMGVDPFREAEGLAQGAQNMASRRGYKTNTYRARDIGQNLFKDFQRRGGSLRALGNAARAQARMLPEAPILAGSLLGGGAVTFPQQKQIVHLPELLQRNTRQLMGSDAAKQMRPTDWRSVTGIMKGHEGSETRYIDKPLNPKGYKVMNPAITGRHMKAMGRAGRFAAVLTGQERSGLLRNLANKLPDTPASFLTSGRHADPRVLLEEIRNSRMFSPQFQTAMTRLRRRTGEYDHLERALQDPGGGTLKIPRNKMRQIGGRMSEIGIRDQKAVSDELFKHMQQPLPGEKVFRKARPFLSKAVKFLRR